MIVGFAAMTLAGSLFTTVLVYNEMTKTEAALKLAETNFQETQSVVDRVDFRQELAISYDSFGVLLADTKELSDAARAFASATADIQRELFKTSPGSAMVLRQLAWSSNRLGQSHARLGQVSAAINALRDSLKSQQQVCEMTADHPQDLWTLGGIWNNYGNEPMFHNLQNLQRSIAQPRHRRQRRMHLVSCETFETRLVLSAVATLSAIEQVSVDTGPQQVSESDAAASEFATNNGVTAQDETVSPRQEISPPGFGGPQDNPPDQDTLPPNALATFFGDWPATGDVPDPDQPPRHRPPLSDATDDATTDNVFKNAAELSERAISVESDVRPLTMNEQTKSDDDESAFVSADGFVEIPRSVTHISKPGSLLPDSLNRDGAVDHSKLRTPFFDLSNESERRATDEENSDVNAAMAFFNRQTDGGFVDAGLDDLHAAAGIIGAHPTTNPATSLEAGLGRFNPFDDSSHTTMLTAVELRHVAESDTGRDGDHNVGTEVALAGVLLGTVEFRNRSLERLLETFRRLVSRFGSFFLSAR